METHDLAGLLHNGIPVSRKQKEEIRKMHEDQSPPEDGPDPDDLDESDDQYSDDAEHDADKITPAPFAAFWSVVERMDWPLDRDDERCSEVIDEWLGDNDNALDGEYGPCRTARAFPGVDRESLEATYDLLMQSLKRHLDESSDYLSHEVSAAPANSDRRPGQWKHWFRSADGLHYLAGCIIGHGQAAFDEVMKDAKYASKYDGKEGFDAVFRECDEDEDSESDLFEDEDFDIPGDDVPVDEQKDIRLIQRLLNRIHINIQTLAEAEYDKMSDVLREKRKARYARKRLKIKVRRAINLAKRNVKAFLKRIGGLFT